jgi:hypothetical protein
MPIRSVSFNTPAELVAFANSFQEATVAAVADGGTGYAVNDVLEVLGGVGEAPALLKVTTATGGVITAVSILKEGAYTTAPTNPVAVIGGAGNGDAEFNLTLGGAITQADVVSVEPVARRWYLSYWV